jgi:hypothetical protein
MTFLCIGVLHTRWSLRPDVFEGIKCTPPQSLHGTDASYAVEYTITASGQYTQSCWMSRVPRMQQYPPVGIRFAITTCMHADSLELRWHESLLGSLATVC